ncbi:MAG: GHMP kinase [Elusimicrobia bacterium]|nr:GHMP kinase [Elusimicrobiota bacterium]
MIISKTPFRISFAGGGTDLSAFYEEVPGAVVSTAVNKYMYLTVNHYLEPKYLLKYSKTELVGRPEQVQHPILREVLMLLKVPPHIEITSMADIPGGTGLGSSSSFTVGLLHALHAYGGQFQSSEELARQACEVEIEKLGEPIGKQDQYIAAYGGLEFIQFNPDGSVFVSPIICSPATKEALQMRLLLFYTGKKRSAASILTQQKEDTGKKKEILKKILQLAQDLRCELQKDHPEALGEILKAGWSYKKQVASKVSAPEIDQAYEAALRAGAAGGKILGAGGGGFLLLYCDENRQEAVRRALEPALKKIPFQLEPQGSKIIYVEPEQVE